MRRSPLPSAHLRAVAAVLALALLGATMTTSPVGAAVPGQPFTRTQCETYSDSVARLYTAALDREPEQGGFDWWLEEYTQGRWTLPLMAQFFVESPEFQQKYGALDDRAYIAQIYRNVLDREADAEGLDFWSGQMAGGMTRAILLLRFSESPENIAKSGTTQPALGEFNEGRAPGAWVCGPDLMAYLPTAAELGAQWRLVAEARSPGAAVESCDTIGYVPEHSTGRLFFGDSNSTSLVIAAYPFATVYGAETFLDDLEAAIPGCASWIDEDGRSHTLTTANHGNWGDRTVGLTRVARTGSSTASEDIVYVRTGRILLAMSIDTLFGTAPPSMTSEVDVALAKLEGLIP